MNDLETLTVKDLQKKLIELGMPEDDVATFKTRAPLIASIKTLMTREIVSEEKLEEAKKVASIEEKPNPVEDRQVNKQWKSKAERMRERLLAQEKVSILIPLDPAEKAGVVEWRTGKDGKPFQVHLSGSVESVQLNGYKYFIPKGIYTPVPRQVAEVISTSQQQTLSAGSNISLDRIDPKTGRPFSEVL